MRGHYLLVLVAGIALPGCSEEKTIHVGLTSSEDPHSSPALEVIKSGREGDTLVVEFNRALDPRTVVDGKTTMAFVDTDLDPGGVFLPSPGDVSVRDERILTFRPRGPVTNRELRLVLTVGIRGRDGSVLVGGEDSAALSFVADVPGAVYEQRARFPAPAQAASLSAAATAAGGPDDHADDPAGATPLPLSRTLRGAIDVSGDEDWFSVVLQSGAAYTFITETQGDTILELLDASGSLLVRNDDDPAGGLHSVIDHVAQTSGTHTLRVTGYGTQTPTYGIRADGPPGNPTTGIGHPSGDDHGGSSALATPVVALGLPVSGVIEVDGDADWFAFDLTAGMQATVTTATSGDTVLAVFDTDGATLLDENDDDPAGGRSSRIEFRAPGTGTFYARVQGYGASTPTYDLLVRMRLVGAPNPSRFSLRPGTDPWHLDFVVFAGAFDQDLSRHGLRSGTAETDRVMRDYVVDQVLNFVSQKFLRTADGDPVSGVSWRISFSSDDPPGSPRWTYSRMAIGGPSDDSGILGTATLDRGNRRKEDNSTPGDLGVFANTIYGRSSFLSPRLVGSDRRYVDGSYRLGDGSSSHDARFRKVRRIAADWAHAIAVVTAHEVGHSVGLDHQSTDRRGVMLPTLSRYALSDRTTHMSAPSARILTRNLRHDP